MNNDFKDFTARLRAFFALADVGSSDPELGATPNPSLIVSYRNKFDPLALDLFALQFKHNAAYRRFCEARGASAENVRSWDQIPAMPTSAFKELELSCLPATERSTVFHSSGTTEHRPSRHFHNSESLGIYEESLWAWFPLKENEEGSEKKTVWTGPDGKRLLILTPPPDQAPHSSLVHMFETIRRGVGCDESAFTGGVIGSNQWTLNFNAILDALREAERSQVPILLLGTAFSYVHLLGHLMKNCLNFNLPLGSWAIETGGYKGRSNELPKLELYSRIKRHLGISISQILSEYGMSELSSQAYDRRWVMVDGRWGPAHERLFYFPPWARAQIVSPETGLEVSAGETGLIRVFDLTNVYSVMAIQTEDLAIRRGDGFELVGRAAKSEPRGCSLQTAQ
jgi:hypothetical protein